MSMESPRNNELTTTENLSILALTTVVGGAMWWFGFSGPEIAAAAGSTAVTGLGVQLNSRSGETPGDRQTRATGRHAIAFGLGSAAAYFGYSDTAVNYFIGGLGGFSLAALPEALPRLFQNRSKNPQV